MPSGLVLAVALTTFAMMTHLGNDLLETLTAMFNPLPAIALLPISLIWFGLGDKSIMFVLVHSVLWAVALNTHSGFKSVSNTLRMVGRNYGLRGIGYVRKILIPAAFPSILTGLKIGWAFAWRTLIAAELVFGASSGKGGLGWFIYESKNQLDIPAVFAGLFTVIIIGLLVENLIFRNIEAATVRKWGMQNYRSAGLNSLQLLRHMTGETGLLVAQPPRRRYAGACHFLPGSHAVVHGLRLIDAIGLYLRKPLACGWPDSKEG